ncbi:hypothetical protein ACWEFL_15865 [Streptomyces sp. NPDC004838]
MTHHPATHAADQLATDGHHVHLITNGETHCHTGHCKPTHIPTTHATRETTS